MKRLSLNVKLWLSLATMWVSLFALAGYNAFEIRKTMYIDREATLDAVLDNAVGVIQGYLTKANAGEMPVDEAQNRAFAELQKMKFGDNGYFYISNTKYVMLMHGVRPELVGKDMTNVRDPKGRNTTAMSADLAKKEGRGFVDIMFPRPGQKEAVPKRVAVRYIKDWDWALNTGLYIDDIDAAFISNLKSHALVALLLGALSSIMMFVIMRNIKSSLGGEPAYAVEVAERIASGDLTVPVKVAADDQHSLLYAMQSMQANLQKVITKIHQGAESISVGAEQISSGNLDLSHRTEQAAASLEETASSMEEMTTTVRQNAENAQQANALARTASETATTGGQVVNQVVESMRRIEEGSKKIVDITSVIEGIAFQTNILALNAAVEAARAGEQGRGFAVVASEVRALAQRSAAASTEIKKLIENSVDTVKQGSTLANSAGETMSKVVESVRRVTDIMNEISAATAEQSNGLTHVNEAVTQMDHATQQNAALVEEAAAAAGALNNQAQELRNAVAAFKV
jgi:methyl-accepting chemotaxis protein